MTGQMAIARALPGVNDLGRSVTPTFLSTNRFYLQLLSIRAAKYARPNTCGQIRAAKHAPPNTRGQTRAAKHARPNTRSQYARPNSRFSSVM